MIVKYKSGAITRFITFIGDDSSRTITQFNCKQAKNQLSIVDFGRGVTDYVLNNPSRKIKIIVREGTNKVELQPIDTQKN